jgi:hypothetical protein
MPCTYLRVAYSTKVNMRDVDVTLLAEALKLMGEVEEVTLYSSLDRVKVYLKVGGQVTLQLEDSSIILTGDNAEVVKKKLEQYYSAVVQALKLRKQGFKNVNVEEVKELLRISARN